MVLLKKQMKSHDKMMRTSGSRVQKCNKGFIIVGDWVQVQQSALLRRVVKETGDIWDYNTSINFVDGAPQYGEEARLVEMIMKGADGHDCYKTVGMKKFFRWMDICRISWFNRGDIVRVSNQQTIGQFRVW